MILVLFKGVGLGSWDFRLFKKVIEKSKLISDINKRVRWWFDRGFEF